MYREAIAAVPPNAEIHFRLGQALTAEPDVNCDEYSPTEIQANKTEGMFHLRKAIEIASQTASAQEPFMIPQDGLRLEIIDHSSVGQCKSLYCHR